MRFNPPPNWPRPPQGWSPPPGWAPDPAWGPVPAGWPLWLAENGAETAAPRFSHHGPTPGAGPGRSNGPMLTDTPEPGVGSANAGRKVDNTFAWTLALAPLVFILLDVVLLQAGVSPTTGWALVLPLAINIALAVADSLRLKALGYRVSTVLAAVFVPAYLIDRSRKIGGFWAIPIVWFVAALMYLASSSVVANVGGIELDEGLVEAGIEDWARDNGAAQVIADCPKGLILPVGGSFECSVTELSGTYTVLVEVVNEQGYVEWSVQP